MIIRYLLHNAYAGGGTVRTVLTMAAALADRGHDVEVVSVVRYRETPAFAFHPGISVRALLDTTAGGLSHAGAWPWQRVERKIASRLTPRDESRFREYNRLLDRRIEAFVTSTRDGVLIGTRPTLNLAVARFAHRDVVTVGQEHLHLSRHRPGLRAVMDGLYPRLDALVALTASDAEAYRRAFRRGPRIVDIPNSVPVPVDGPRARLRDPVIVAAGRLTKQKGFDRLLYAFAQMVETRPQWKLRIYGTGKNEPRLQQIIDNRGLGDSARLMGFSSRLAQDMADASIFAMTSRFEGFPMVMLEAMAVGLPVVSFDFPTGPRDLVSEDVNGVLVADGDLKAFARALVRLADDEPLRQRWGAAGLETVRRYTASSVAVRWEQLLTECVERHGALAGSRSD